ncbi:hypothetical protein AAFP35_16575 [Gordonia sp. CPCC 206044]|uniref:hypothetical protein n=1 Tax=Gordonia sp. CPCC 206044 TaxID=3140793 RepID=UPI003AF36FAB
MSAATIMLVTVVAGVSLGGLFTLSREHRPGGLGLRPSRRDHQRRPSVTPVAVRSADDVRPATPSDVLPASSAPTRPWIVDFAAQMKSIG